MQIYKEVSLADYSTMRLGGKADFLVEATNKKEMADAVVWSQQNNVPFKVIGDGSNIIWKDDGYPGLVIVNKLKGFKTIHKNNKELIVEIAAGENWDQAVSRIVEMGYSGIELLSLIPGTAGATPIQNVGAYGSEIKDTLISVEAFGSMINRFVTLQNDECNFSYRNSRFKNQNSDKNRFIITSISLKLTSKWLDPPFYSSLQEYLDINNISEYSPTNIRNAVKAIRSSKLPDPKKQANNGSFFFNPIIDVEKFKSLQETYPEIVSWNVSKKQVKISAAWLIEKSGYHKGYKDLETGMGLWEKQALVVVNYQSKSYRQLESFVNKIRQAVINKFDIELKIEPEIV